MSDEVRITDPSTGGQKGKKRAQLSAIDPASVLLVAEVAGFGAEKYERLNFVKGYSWSLSYDALQRHLHAFWGGEDNDPESGLPHLAHAAWHALALLTFSKRSRGTDDRITTLFPAATAAPDVWPGDIKVGSRVRISDLSWCRGGQVGVVTILDTHDALILFEDGVDIWFNSEFSEPLP